MSGRGGPREGAGAKPKYSTPMRRYQVMLDERSVMILRRLGKTNLSMGIRLAAARSV